VLVRERYDTALRRGVEWFSVALNIFAWCPR